MGVDAAARQSLYVNFDPLVGGRPSVLGRPSVAPFARKTEPEDLIAINTPVNGPVRPTKQSNQPAQNREEIHILILHG
jgi:hypothetical protein